jgi:hypothetical protein
MVSDKGERLQEPQLIENSDACCDVYLHSALASCPRAHV